MYNILFCVFLLFSVSLGAETLEEKRKRCFKDCTQYNPDVDRMGKCFLEEANCVYPEENPPFNEVKEEESGHTHN